MQDTSRRRVLGGAGAAVVGTVTLAACGDNTPTEHKPAGKDGAGSDSADPTGGASTDTKPTGGDTLVALDKVPVGGAVSAKGAKGEPLIVARPDSTTAVCFSAICTHMGCTVKPAGKELHCPCHGSVYQATTGKNISGPAPSPLPKVAVHVTSGNVITN